MKKFLLILIPFLILVLIFSLKTEEKIGITIFMDDKEIVLDKEDIYNSPDSSSFQAIVRSSGEKPYEAEYTGIELTKLFTNIGLDIRPYKRITFNASDGYRIILSIEEIMDPNNAYLTYKRDGELMKSKKKGGNGPFQLVL